MTFSALFYIVYLYVDAYMKGWHKIGRCQWSWLGKGNQEVLGHIGKPAEEPHREESWCVQGPDSCEYITYLRRVGFTLQVQDLAVMNREEAYLHLLKNLTSI